MGKHRFHLNLAHWREENLQTLHLVSDRKIEKLFNRSTETIFSGKACRIQGKVYNLFMLGLVSVFVTKVED